MIKKVFKERPVKIIFTSLCILLFISLKIGDDYAPLSIHNWNKEEISRIKITDLDNFTFAVRVIPHHLLYNYVVAAGMKQM